MADWRLLADIGGTNARFALQRSGEAPEHIEVLHTQDYADLAEAVQGYLAALDETPKIARAGVCVAGPVVGDRFQLTNARWEFSIEETRKALGLDKLHVVNDFAAVALAVPHLRPDWLVQIGGEAPVARAPIAVMGAGTGLGVCGLLPSGETAWIPVPGEAGHTSMAAMTPREDAVVAHIRRTFGHCSCERLLSGGGLVNIYHALAAVDGVAGAPVQPEDITRMAAEGDARADEAVEIFCQALGTVASNMALTFTALGGVYLAGGIVREFGQRFAESGFRTRFEEKGRFHAFLKPIPVFQIAQPFSAMIGLAAMLDAEA